MPCTCETLDPRLLLAATADAGDTLATAMDLGRVASARAIANTLSDQDRNDYFKFTVGAKGNVNISLARLDANLNIRLLNRNGNAIVRSANDGTTAETISRTLGAGAYFLHVLPAEGVGAASYRLRIQADLNWTTITQNGQRRNIGVVFADGSTGPIRTDRQTWLIVHGWNSSPDSLSAISDAVRESQPDDQVLVVDWSAAAGQDLMAALDAVKPAGSAVAKTLKRWKIPGSRVNLIGHSFGGFFIDRISAAFSGGVNRIVAIDPADDVITDVNYAARSNFSLAFIATTSYSTPKHALTADVTFKMNVGPMDSILSHMAAAELYAAMLQANADGSPDDVSALFALDRLTSTGQPWKTGSGYEGTLTGEGFLIFGWEPKSLTYKSRATGKSVTVKA